jgi:hypothetical protein
VGDRLVLARLEIMTSHEYAQIDIDRENGVEDRVVLAANQTCSKFASAREPR